MGKDKETEERSREVPPPPAPALILCGKDSGLIVVDQAWGEKGRIGCYRWEENGGGRKNGGLRRGEEGDEEGEEFAVGGSWARRI